MQQWEYSPSVDFLPCGFPHLIVKWGLIYQWEYSPSVDEFLTDEKYVDFLPCRTPEDKSLQGCLYQNSAMGSGSLPNRGAQIFKN